MLLSVLVEGGRSDLAMRLLLLTTYPSWLDQVERGATTVWESSEGYDTDGRGKASHNHYALGSVAGWLTEGLAGLSPRLPATPGSASHHWSANTSTMLRRRSLLRTGPPAVHGAATAVR